MQKKPDIKTPIIWHSIPTLKAVYDKAEIMTQPHSAEFIKVSSVVT